ncbi:hypothetical protein M6G53_23365 [Serratia nevei]|uniref:hypothetical protein n=1 Tax=Serratia nevei TaxID=2703794 RepID=UPI0020A1A361|nr:hypothetical protein [Serratia nevei]MCP1108310.1 hypothetical protein [Serratia nevei]
MAQAAARAMPGSYSFCIFTARTANHRRFLSAHGVWQLIILSGEVCRNKIIRAVLYLYFHPQV